MSEESGNSQLTVPKPLLFDQALWRRRSIRDIVARYLVGAGGIAVIGSIILIFLFLFAVVFPLFKGAHLEKLTSYSLQDTLNSEAVHESLLYSIEEQAEIGMRMLSNGAIQFFDINNGELIKQVDLLEEKSGQVTSWTHVDIEQNIINNIHYTNNTKNRSCKD